MDATNTVGEGKQLETILTPAITVSQPQKLESLIETINLLNTVSERIGEDRSGDMGGGGSGTGGQQGDDDGQQTARDIAIASLPPPPLMQHQLEKHIQKEVKKLRREVRRATRRAGKPGAAHKLNDLYARIRRLNGILKELLSSSVEVLERLYIRIFIDRQPVFGS